MELQPYNWWRAQPGTICSDLWILVAETPDGRFSWSRPPTQENASQVTELWPQKTQSGTSMRFRWVSKENLRFHPRNFWPQWFVNDVDFFGCPYYFSGCVCWLLFKDVFWMQERCCFFDEPKDGSIFGHQLVGGCVWCAKGQSLFFSVFEARKKAAWLLYEQEIRIPLVYPMGSMGLAYFPKWI